jgi:hypothetical protein
MKKIETCENYHENPEDCTCSAGYDQFDVLAEQVLKAKKAIKYYEAIEKRLMKELLEVADEHSMATEKFELRYIERIGSVNYSIIPELENVNINLYRKPSIATWSLTEKMTKPDVTGLELK